MKQGIMNLGKMAEKTSLAVRRVCLKRAENGELPIGFSIVFYDPTRPDGERFNIGVYLAGDPHDEESSETRKKIEQAMVIAMEAISELFKDGVEIGERTYEKGSVH